MSIDHTHALFAALCIPGLSASAGLSAAFVGDASYVSYGYYNNGLGSFGMGGSFDNMGGYSTGATINDFSQTSFTFARDTGPGIDDPFKFDTFIVGNIAFGAKGLEVRIDADLTLGGSFAMVVFDVVTPDDEFIAFSLSGSVDLIADDDATLDPVNRLISTGRYSISIDSGDFDLTIVPAPSGIGVAFAAAGIASRRRRGRRSPVTLG